MENELVIPDYVTKLLSSSFHGIPNVILELASIVNTTVILTNSFFEELINTSKTNDVQIDYLESFCPLETEENLFKRCFLKMEQKEYVGLCYPIKVNNVVKNYLIVVCKDSFLNTANKLSEIILFTGNLLELELKKNETIILEKKKLKEVFIYDLLYGNVKNLEEIITYGQLWNWNFHLPHIVATFALKDFYFYSDDPKHLESIKYTITKVLEENLEPCITLVKKSEVIVIYLVDSIDKFKDFDLYISHIKNYLEKFDFSNRVYIGIGKQRKLATEIFRTYQEALIAYELGEILNLPIAKFSSLGLEKILFNHNTQELREFFDQVIGQLMIEDKINNSSLVETLEEYVFNQFDINKTAESMFIHKNTLRYRLKKIEELLNIKLADIEVRLNITTAIKIKQLGKLK